jgi:hypothetical protein
VFLTVVSDQLHDNEAEQCRTMRLACEGCQFICSIIIKGHLLPIQDHYSFFFRYIFAIH